MRSIKVNGFMTDLKIGNKCGNCPFIIRIVNRTDNNDVELLSCFLLPWEHIRDIDYVCPLCREPNFVEPDTDKVLVCVQCDCHVNGLCSLTNPDWAIPTLPKMPCYFDRVPEPSHCCLGPLDLHRRFDEEVNAINQIDSRLTSSLATRRKVIKSKEDTLLGMKDFDRTWQRSFFST